ncbi:DUF1569 domain-containing protein [Maribacter huludaoensis]|uniref:DUF1569 domain-containing protein n=1 Tax=Maribacter huludaoensis TaxID=3030010 RepID=UPI0023EC1A9C|nr:DUF1569 domain-containing protein [Maribacter huludaoensis]MDF4221384.1 DUF1569 domain-containing protein [Maribacter huludaoensis]
MKSLLTEDGYQDITSRIEKLSENSKKGWGKMTVGQMAWHCQYPLQLAITNKPNSSKGNWFVRTFFKKSLYNEKPWRKNLPTSSLMKTADEKDFKKEIAKLKSLIDDFYAVRTRDKWYPHPAFGVFTPEQWGQLEYKHLDHHLKQFGV